MSHHDLDDRVQWAFLNPAPPAFSQPVDAMAFDADNRLQTWNATSVSHDDDGNMTFGPLPSGTWATYGYDARNRLNYILPVGASVPTWSCRYGADGQRVSVTDLRRHDELRDRSQCRAQSHARAQQARWRDHVLRLRPRPALRGDRWRDRHLSLRPPRQHRAKPEGQPEGVMCELSTTAP